ncbi:HD domain-containing protein [Chryseolinea sp. H1M3-3]|uniref:HD domain-containing protein n=1 Tax=Chryseolinea sp. H1M3-3 TaxID=3034144 RepID=UPI0023EAFA10|nr:HD domain-containing protein [Chryseolinea sp. H1M3-3]
MIKKKLINDPVYGFITIPSELIYEIISHRFFQRLRHIKQLGLTHYVYPGALHTRFQHALGAMHLMGKVLDQLRLKGVEISHQEYEASQISILLHDIGHGPFSHTLEHVLLSGIKHESLSYLFIDKLNEETKGALNLTLQIFRDSYPRKFFHQLISSQLDIDRLDYLKRDCFFTGVQEGTIGVDRILAMLNVHQDQLVVEEKGIYSIENFLNARRLMYWQVYLHKTSVSAERMLVNVIRRAQALVRADETLPASDALHVFLKNKLTLTSFKENEDLLSRFGELDDNDIWGSLKCWQNNSDNILSLLSRMLLERRLFKVRLSIEPIRRNEVANIQASIMKTYNTLRSETPYLFSHGIVSNEAYAEGHQINILMRNGELLDIAQASDLPNIKAISKIVKKNYLCWPKNVSLLNS